MITLYHVIELLGHGSNDVVADRVKFVRALGQIFWVRAQNGDGIGTVLDLQAAEARTRLAEPSASYHAVLDRTRPQVLAFGEAERIAELLEETDVIAYARERIQRRRVVQSLARTEVAEPHLIQRRVNPEQCRERLTTILSRFDRQQQHLASQLKAVGDSRLVEQDQIAKHFFDELRAEIKAAARGGIVNLADVLRDAGIEEGDLARSVSADQLADKYIWKTQSRIIARVAGVAASAVETLRSTDIPSHYLCEQIAKSRKGSLRAEGGDFADASLACLSFYCGVTAVDKRTAEYVRQIRVRSPELDGVMGVVVRLTSLDAVEAAMRMRAWTG